MTQDEINKSFTYYTLTEDPNESFTINGIEFANRREYDERIESDAHDFAACTIFTKSKNTRIWIRSNYY